MSVIIHTYPGVDPYINISPIKVKFNDTIEANALTVRSIYDNLHTTCQLYYELGTITTNTDDSGTVISASFQSLLNANSTLNGTDYTDWNGDNTYPFEYVANSLGLTPLP